MLCTVEEIRKRKATTSRYKTTRSTKTRANSPSDSESNKPSMMGVTDGNEEALAAGIALAATMGSFVCIHET